jgi:hypothetical protein
LDIEERENARMNPKPKGEWNIPYLKYWGWHKPLAKKACQSTATSKLEALDKNGILVDIDVQFVGDSGSTWGKNCRHWPVFQ